MGGTHTDADLHFRPNGNEGLEHGPVGVGHFVSRQTSFRYAGESGRICGRAGVGSMRGEHTEMHQEHHRSRGNQHDDRVQRSQLTVV